MLKGGPPRGEADADGLRAQTALWHLWVRLMACVCVVPGECDVLIAAISVKVLPVGCVTSADADVDAACILERPMSCFVVLVAGPHEQGQAGYMSISGRRSAARWPIVSAELCPPQIALGYPWASSLVCRRHAQPGRRRWVAGVVERCGLTASNDWLMARALRERDVAGQGANLASWSFPIPKLGTAPAPTKVWLSHQPPDLATGDGGRPATRLSAEKCTNNLVPSRLGHQQGISSTCDWLSPAAPVSPGILPLTVRRCGRG
jgi:hypothetical protein